MAAKYGLTEGVLQTIMKGGEVDNPVLQVLGSKKIHSGTADKERYRLLVSDGIYTISFAMLTTQINDKVGISGIEKYTVIRVKKYVTSVINNDTTKDTRILLILDMDVVASAEQVGSELGNPKPLTDMGTKSESSASKASYSAKPEPASMPRTNGHMANSSTSTQNLEGQLTHPISSLSPYHNKWIIKARVTNKSNIRTWSNSRGEGKLFSFDLLDDSGEIRCTAFRDLVDKYFDYIQVDKLYFISKCQLKTANKQFSTLKNDYEMTLTAESIIQECHDEDVSIPQTKYNFTPIDKISQIEVGSLIDVIGICKNVSDLLTFQARSTGRELKKKEVNLVDQSNTSVALTLWGADAENFNGTNNPVIVIKGAKVGEFGGGKNLSTIGSSLMKVNPDIPESFKIRSWYDNDGHLTEATNISARSGSGTFQTQWMSFKQVRDQGLGSGDKGDYYQTLGTILLFRSENCYYKACPSEDCKKKVIDLENGMYRCEKCNREYPNFKYLLLGSVNVGDWSDSQWVSMFSSEVEKILGMTAQEVGDTIENNSEGLAMIADRANFKQFIFKCRAKMETYNDETRLKTVAVKVENVNYPEYNAHLIERIRQLTN